MFERFYAEARRVCVVAYNRGFNNLSKNGKKSKIGNIHLSSPFKLIHNLNENALEAKDNWLS